MLLNLFYMKKVNLKSNFGDDTLYKKICIVAPEFLPVPATKGGAIETLIQTILDENELDHKIDIVCVTRFNRKSKQLYNKYKYTKFIPIKIIDKKRGFGRFVSGINFAIKKIFKFDIRFNIRKSKYENAIQKSNADLIVFESTNNYISENFTSKIGKNKFILHLHKIYNPNEEWEKQFELIIALSDYCKNRLSSNGLIPKNRIHVLYNGIDLSKFDRNSNEIDNKKLREHYGIDDDQLIIIYTGRIMEIKGVEELICAYKKIDKKNKSCLLICGGDIDNRNKGSRYLEHVKKLSKGSNIVFTGYIPNEDLYKYYNLADIAVFPSTGEEGLGNVVVEAMACKLPTIISNSGGMPELVNNNTSLIVKLGDSFVDDLSKAIDRLLLDKDLREKMGYEGYLRSKEFSSKKYFDDYINIILKKV